MTYLHRKVECILVLVIILTTGCASKNPYHTVDATSDNCVDRTADQCTQSYYQEHPDYDLAFAEFTERGNAFSSKLTRKKIKMYWLSLVTVSADGQ